MPRLRRITIGFLICAVTACSSPTTTSTSSTSTITATTSNASPASGPAPSSAAPSGAAPSSAAVGTSASVQSSTTLTTATSVGLSVSPTSTSAPAPSSAAGAPTVLHPVTIAASVEKSASGGVQVLTLATVKGQQYAFIVDTGASVSVLDSTLVGKLGLPNAGPAGQAGQVGCTSSAQPVTLTDWSIGGQKLPTAVVLSSKVGFSGKTFQGHQVAGLLGNEVFQAFGTLQIDYASNSITMGAKAAAGKPSFPVVVASRKGSTELLAAPTLHGQQIGMLVDSGASTTLLDAAVATKVGLAKVGGPSKISGVSCTSAVQPVTVDQLAVNGIKLPTVTGVSIGSGTSGGDGTVAGLLGSDVLSTYGTVTFDYTGKSVTLGG